MKIKVDFDLCESNALCEAMAPEVFELDDDDFLQLKTEETTDENVEDVRRAVAACPRAATAQALMMTSATIIFALNFKGTSSVKNFALSMNDQSVKRDFLYPLLEQS